MQLTDYLEKEEERIIQTADAAQSCEEASAALLPLLDRILYRYNEDVTDDADRMNASAMMQILSGSLPLLTCSGCAGVWLKGSRRGAQSDYGGTDSTQKYDAKTWILTGAGAVCLLLSLLLASRGSGLLSGLTAVLLAVLLTAAGAAALIFAGRRMAGGKSGRKITVLPNEEDLRIDIRPDGKKTYLALRTAMLTIDKNIERLHTQIRELSADGEEREISEDMLDYCAELLEAACLDEGRFALDKCRQAEYFLHRQGIEVEKDYSKYPDFFSSMPGRQTRLVVPALTQDGNLYRKGVYTQEM